MGREILTTKRKALAINLDGTFFGTIAEIGGGQEVARYFFQAGGASGTIAKTISAYDKYYSDFLYNNNEPDRYVSDERLMKMLAKEYTEVEGLLRNIKEKNTRFFAFANTVTTLNFKKDNESHGWIGIRFQLNHKHEPNEVLIHVRLLENDGILQQNTLGMFGINLIYACLNYWEWPNTFLQSLLDNLANDRIEVNMVSMKGPELNYVDNRLLAVQLVKNGMTNVTMFDRKGHVFQPADKIHKKDILVLRGSFRPITCVGFDMIKTGFATFRKDTDLTKSRTVILCEMTLNNLVEEGTFNEKDYLDRVDLLNAMGLDVMISNFREYYRLVAYFAQFKINQLRLVIGSDHLMKVLDKQYYNNLKGGLLEAFGRLFIDQLKIYVYPSLHDGHSKIYNSQNIEIPDEIKYLYKHLIENKKIIDIETVKSQNLNITSHEVLRMIKNKEPGWEKMVLRNVASYIKEKKLFDYSE